MFTKTLIVTAVIAVVSTQNHNQTQYPLRHFTIRHEIFIEPQDYEYHYPRHKEHYQEQEHLNGINRKELSHATIQESPYQEKSQQYYGEKQELLNKAYGGQKHGKNKQEALNHKSHATSHSQNHDRRTINVGKNEPQHNEYHYHRHESHNGINHEVHEQEIHHKSNHNELEPHFIYEVQPTAYNYNHRESITEPVYKPQHHDVSPIYHKDLKNQHNYENLHKHYENRNHKHAEYPTQHKELNGIQFEVLESATKPYESPQQKNEEPINETNEQQNLSQQKQESQHRQRKREEQLNNDQEHRVKKNELNHSKTKRAPQNGEGQSPKKEEGEKETEGKKKQKASKKETESDNEQEEEENENETDEESPKTQNANDKNEESSQKKGKKGNRKREIRGNEHEKNREEQNWEHQAHPKFPFIMPNHEIKHHYEKRNGDVFQGEYSMRQPDGTIRIIEYQAYEKKIGAIPV